MCILRASLTCSAMATRWTVLLPLAFPVKLRATSISEDKHIRSSARCLTLTGVKHLPSLQFPSPQATAHRQDSKFWNLDMNPSFLYPHIHHSLPTRVVVWLLHHLKIYDNMDWMLILSLRNFTI